MRVKCSYCERVVKAYIPKGGDGSGYRPYRHNKRDPAAINIQAIGINTSCPGSYVVVADTKDWLED